MLLRSAATSWVPPITRRCRPGCGVLLRGWRAGLAACSRPETRWQRRELTFDMDEASSAARRAAGGKAWRRVLYENQKYEDNFVDPERFLAQLTISRPPLHPHYVQAFTFASLVAQQFCAVTVFVAYYKYLRLGLWKAEDIALLNVSLIVLGLLLYYLLSDIPPVSKRTQIVEKIKIGAIFMAWLLLATPVLQTLTLSFSEDTVHALAIAMVALHLTCHDYEYVNASTDTFSGSVSLNAAIFTGILLASRLDNHSMVMHAVLLAFLTFSLFPVIARLVKIRSQSAHWVLVGAQALTSAVLLGKIDRTLLVVFVLIVLLLVVVAPLLFLRMQSLKVAFHGPWEISNDL